MDFGPYRGELVACCYRMLGSFNEAVSPPTRARFDTGIRADLRLALVAAMQILPPRQCARSSSSMYGPSRRPTLPLFTVTGGMVDRNVVFADPRVFEAFDLPAQIS